jgi:hypothetical protein
MKLRGKEIETENMGVMSLTKELALHSVGSWSSEKS